jgi:hypothetical protein
MSLNTSKKRKIYKTIFSILLGIYFMFIHPKLINAQTPLFQDDFNNGGASDWEEYHPWGDWYVENKEYVGTVQLQASPGEQPSYAIAGDKSWQDYSFQVDIKGTEGIDKVILFRINEHDNAYKLNLRSGYHAGGNDISLGKRLPVGTSGGSLLRRESFINFQNTKYRVKVDVKNETNGVLIKVFIDTDNSPILQYLDKVDPIRNGAIGLEVWPGGYSSGANLRTTTHYDNVSVTTLPEGFPTPSPLPILKVSDIKQYDPLWKDKEYDRASEWAPSMDTIERWGCGLTSATIVLQYHGFSINPDELNDWLNDEPDGYIRNGLLNWLAVSRFTYQNTTGNSPTLEFRRYGTSSTTLEEELNAERPPILGLAGHFIVVKGKQDSDFLINDPDSTSTLLSQVETDREVNYSAIYSYLTSNTDLSYIMLVVDSDITLEIYNSDDQSVGNFYPNEFLEDDFGNNESEHLNIFLLPTPADGVYKVEATGLAGSYQLDSYLYNKQGIVQIVPLEGIIIGEDQSDKYLMTIGETSTIEQIITEDPQDEYPLVGHLSARVTSVTTNKDYYKEGDALGIEVQVTNDGELVLDPTKEKLTINIKNSNGWISGSFREQQKLDLDPGESETFTFYTSPQFIPKSWSEGNYTVSTTIYSTRASPLGYLPGGQSSNTQFIVDKIRPVITWNNPLNGSLLGDNVELNVNCDGTDGPCDYVNFWWFEVEGWADNSTKRYHQIWEDGNFFSWILDSVTPELANGNTGDKLDGDYTLRAATKDKAGNYSHSEIQVVFDNTSPNVPINLGFNVPPGDYSEPRPETDVACGEYTNENQISHHWTDESESGAVLYQRQWQYPGGSTWHGAEEWETSYTNYRSFGGGEGAEGLWGVRVRARDLADNWSEWSKACVVIYDKTSPSSFFTSPSDGGIFGGPEGESIHIVGFSTDKLVNTIDYTEIYYQLSGSEDKWKLLETFMNEGEDEPFNWETYWIPEEDGAYDFRAIATDRAGNVEKTAYIYGVIYDTTDPELSWTSPVENTVISGTTVILSVATDNLSGFDSVTYLSQREGEVGWHEIDTLTNSPYKYDWDTTDWLIFHQKLQVTQ